MQDPSGTERSAASSRAAGDVVVIGAGTAGLAVAAELRRRGIAALVLDRAAAVGAQWDARYERLHLHTVRRHSRLPGTAIPRSSGRFVPAADMARYLRSYASARGLRIRAATRVVGVDELPGARDGARWAVRLDSGEWIAARTVVVATGRASEPIVPEWFVGGSFRGERVLASEYRRGSDFAGMRVLVVGAGNSGGEIAVDLAESGAASVDIAVRTRPWILRRELGPFFSTQELGILTGWLPTAVLDPVGRVVSALTVPALSRYGLPRPRVGIATRVRRDGVVPLQDVGLIRAVRTGAVRVRPAVARLTGEGARFVDDAVAGYDAVIAATGYRTGLASVVPLRFLDDRDLPVRSGAHAAAPGLYFAGFTVSLRGAIEDAGVDARRIARVIAGSSRVGGRG